MQFLQSPRPRPPRPPESRTWLPALLVSAAAIAMATRWPWIEVQFVRLFGAHTGPPGWHTTAGFTCLCTGVLVAVLALAETRTPSSREAVRTGSLVLMVLATLTLAGEFVAGPGTLRGVSASRTVWFWLACTSVPLLLLICVERSRCLRSSQNG